MIETAQHLAQGYHSINPYLIVKGTAEAIEFYKQAFGATELMRLTNAQGRIIHAEVQIGDSVVMMAEESPNFPLLRGPQGLGASPVQIHLYVEDVDAVAKRAIEAGASIIMPIVDAGEDRRGGLTDPFGHIWWIATRLQDISRAEITRQFEESQSKSNH
jgi:PhnB protein